MKIHEKKEILIENTINFQDGLKRGDVNIFNKIFHLYYTDLVLFAGNFISIKEVCEDIVQSVFLVLWHERENIVFESSLKSYLLKSVKNRCIDHIRHLDVRREYNEYITNISVSHQLDTEHYILYSDLHDNVEKALAQLSTSQRDVLLMSRFEGLKYKEIAQRLNVSERTIEVRMSEALKNMRHFLKEYFVMILSFLFC